MSVPGTGSPGERSGGGRGLASSVVGLAILPGWFVVTRLAGATDLRVWDVVALRFSGGTLVLLPVLRDTHLEGRDFIVGDEYSIADTSGWGWIDRANFVLPGSQGSACGVPERPALVSRYRCPARDRRG